MVMKIVLVNLAGRMVALVLDVTIQDVTIDRYQAVAERLEVYLVVVMHVAETVVEWAWSV